jgi:hypothetical protein
MAALSRDKSARQSGALRERFCTQSQEMRAHRPFRFADSGIASADSLAAVCGDADCPETALTPRILDLSVADLKEVAMSLKGDMIMAIGWPRNFPVPV